MRPRRATGSQGLRNNHSAIPADSQIRSNQFRAGFIKMLIRSLFAFLLILKGLSRVNSILLIPLDARVIVAIERRDKLGQG